MTVDKKIAREIKKYFLTYSALQKIEVKARRADSVAYCVLGAPAPPPVTVVALPEPN